MADIYEAAGAAGTGENASVPAVDDETRRRAAAVEAGQAALGQYATPHTREAAKVTLRHYLQQNPPAALQGPDGDEPTEQWPLDPDERQAVFAPVQPDERTESGS